MGLLSRVNTAANVVTAVNTHRTATATNQVAGVLHQQAAMQAAAIAKEEQFRYDTDPKYRDWVDKQRAIAAARAAQELERRTVMAREYWKQQAIRKAKQAAMAEDLGRKALWMIMPYIAWFLIPTSPDRRSLAKTWVAVSLVVQLVVFFGGAYAAAVG